MAKITLESVVREVSILSLLGVNSDKELARLEKGVNILKEIRDEGKSPYSNIDELIEKGEEAIERRYTYLEEVASLGNNWW